MKFKNMQHQHLVHIIFFVCFLQSGANENSEYWSAVLGEQVYNMTKNIPLIGCTLECYVTAEDLHFYWYSVNNIENELVVNFHSPALINQIKTTVYIIPGYFGKVNRSWVQEMKRIFILQYHYDVVLVDWSAWSQMDYITSASATKWVGFIIGKFLANLYLHYAIPAENVMIVGFSLGAHVSGFAGKKFEELTKQKLPLIIALDPAGPILGLKPETERLSPNDAIQVKVLHCNAYEFGIYFACGTLDIWINGGCYQPGCLAVFYTNPLTVAANIACSHFECSRVFIKALLYPRKIMAYECSSPWTGCNTAEPTGDRGIYLGDLKTSHTGQYCLNTEQGESSLFNYLSAFVANNSFYK